MKARCNNVFDCLDESDESVCEPFSIDKKKYSKTFPPFTGSKKTIINIKIAVYEISNIDELAMTFTSEVQIFLTWRDERITFRNLGHSKKLLSKDWHDQIWLPPLYFGNSKGSALILSSNFIKVFIIPLGQPLLNKISELNEANIFKGEENDLELSSWKELTFKCNFELWRYPFDIQKCSVEVSIPIELRNYTLLNPIEFKYTGIFHLIIQTENCGN